MSSILEDSHPRVGDSRPPPPGAWGVQGAGEVGSFPENEVNPHFNIIDNSYTIGKYYPDICPKVFLTFYIIDTIDTNQIFS